MLTFVPDPKGKLMLVTELAPLGALSNYLKDPKNQVRNGLSFMQFYLFAFILAVGPVSACLIFTFSFVFSQCWELKNFSISACRSAKECDTWYALIF